MRIVIGGVLLGILLATGAAGKLWVRTEVAGENIGARIDTFLGGMEVKRKEIEHRVKGLQDGLTKLRKSKIRAQVQHDFLENRIEPIQRRRDSINAALKSIREPLATGSSAKIGGESFQPQQLQRLARQMLQDRDRCDQEIGSLRNSKTQLASIVTTLEGQQSEYEQRLSVIQSQLAIIDAKQSTLIATKQAAAAIDGDAATLVGSVSQLESKVGELYADIEAELISENARWNEGKASESMEMVIAAAESSNNLVSRIDEKSDPGKKD